MREFALVVATAFSTGGLRADPADLPFSFHATEEKIDAPPEYLGPNHLAGTSFCPVKMDGEFWVIGQNAANSAVLRYKGTTMEDGVRQPDGAAAFPIPGVLGGGAWYDSATQTLYAPVLVATLYFGQMRREVHVASSPDKGMTWKDLGPIVTNPDATGSRHPVSDQSGLYWDGGDGDPVLYVEAKTRYAYLYTTHAYWPKIGASVRPILEHRVARCSLDDELAPAHWRKWYDGAWSEPGVGGLGTPVNASAVTYNTYLKKYVAWNGASTLAVSTDLEEQDWSPAYAVGDFWDSVRGAVWATDETKSDVAVSGQNVFVYDFLPGASARRFNGAFDAGTVPAAAGFSASSFAPDFAGIEATPANDYGFQPLRESDESVWARRTRRVGCTSAEMIYKGNWTDEHADDFYEGQAKSAADKGAEVSFTFHGREIDWRAVQGPDAGQAEVYLDGKLAATVDCWASRENPLALLFSRHNLGDRDHVIRVVATGGKNPLSSGSIVRHMVFEYGAESWRASDDFSGVAGKNQWSNLERNGSSYDDLTFSEPFWTSGDGCQVGFTRMTSGTGDAARKWIAPHDGTVRIEGTPAIRGTFSDELDVSVLRDEANAWTAALTSAKPGAACDVNVPVKKGNALYFIVHCSAPPSDAAAGLEVLDGRKTFQVDAHAHGLSFNAASRVLVHLAKPARSLTAPCAIDDRANAAVIASPFLVKVEGHALHLASNQTFGESPLPIDLNGATDFEIDASPHVELFNAVVTFLDGSQVQLFTLPLQDPHDGPPSVDWDPVITYVK
jgi:hypothetical protein